MKSKIITFYLPQFHVIPENDQWWGKGFTDWTSTKNAKPLFWGHYQPRLPAHEYYYNLLDKETMLWQAGLAKKAGIYGFCIYHYWFGKGNQLLEKPAENLLKWNDIELNYCFSWANASWIRSWSKIRGEAWLNAEDKEEGNGLLVKQEYGDEAEWKKHFLYLLPFFKDERYIKTNGKPLFIIYNPNDIKRIKAMMKYWNELAKEHGIPGIYFVGTNIYDWKKKNMDAGVIFEPGCYFNEQSRLKHRKELLKVLHFLNLPNIINYDKIWNKILKRPYEKGTFLGGIVDFDDSPRRGKNGRLMWGMTPTKFGKYFGKMYRRACERGDEFVFLNGWNEWGEGAYLEPDAKYGMRCLQEIRNIVKEK